MDVKEVMSMVDVMDKMGGSDRSPGLASSFGSNWTFTAASRRPSHSVSLSVRNVCVGIWVWQLNFH